MTKILNFSGRSFILSRLSNREKVNKIFTTLDFKALILLFSHLTRLKRLSIKTTSLFLTSLNLFLNYDERGFFLKISYFCNWGKNEFRSLFRFPPIGQWSRRPISEPDVRDPSTLTLKFRESFKFKFFYHNEKRLWTWGKIIKCFHSHWYRRNSNF